VRTYSDPALYFNADSYSNNSVPEPSSVLMLGTGLLVFGGTFKRKFFSARNRNL
jgi:hypothetical protein